MNCFLMGMISSPFLGPFPNAFGTRPILTVFFPAFCSTFYCQQSQPSAPQGKSAWCQLCGKSRKKEMAPDSNKTPSVLQDLSLLSQLQRNFYFVGGQEWLFWGDGRDFCLFFDVASLGFFVCFFVFNLSIFQECQRHKLYSDHNKLLILIN